MPTVKLGEKWIFVPNWSHCVMYNMIFNALSSLRENEITPFSESQENCSAQSYLEARHPIDWWWYALQQCLLNRHLCCPQQGALQRAGAAYRKTEKKKLTEIKGTRRDREVKHGARAQQIQRGRSKMFGTAKQSDLRDCIKGTEWHGHDEAVPSTRWASA